MFNNLVHQRYLFNIPTHFDHTDIFQIPLRTNLIVGVSFLIRLMTMYTFKVKMLYTLIPVLVDTEELVFVQTEEHMRLETTMIIARPSNVSMVK